MISKEKTRSIIYGSTIVLMCGVVILSKNNLENKITAIEAEKRNQEMNYMVLAEDYEKLNTNNEQLKVTMSSLVQENKELNDKILELEMENIELKSAEIQIDDSYEQVPAENSNWIVGQDMLIPALNTHVKLCTDYRWYQVAGTPHYRMQLASWTDDLGLRRYGTDYVVGLGSYYSTSIGDRFEITLDTGKTFVVILGDGKADCDTDIKNMYTPCMGYDGLPAANVLEFIIDKDAVSAEMYNYGSVDYYNEFKGNIIKMTYTGRDTTNDWDTYY